jgi:hypothetical protein
MYLAHPGISFANWFDAKYGTDKFEIGLSFCGLSFIVAHTSREG